MFFLSSRTGHLLWAFKCAVRQETALEGNCIVLFEFALENTFGSVSYTVVPSNEQGAFYSKHAQPSCPTPYARLVPVHSDQAFPTLQLLILPSSSPFTPAPNSPFTPALRSLLLSVHSCSPFTPAPRSSVRFFHGLFILYESSTTLPFWTNLPPYESLSVRFFIRLYMSTSLAVNRLASLLSSHVACYFATLPHTSCYFATLTRNLLFCYPPT